MKKNNFLSLIFAAICSVLIITSCSNSNQKSVENNSAVHTVSPEDIITRGEYLVTIMGCNDFHSPKKWGQTDPILQLQCTCNVAFVEHFMKVHRRLDLYICGI